ncbi:MAG: DUF5946 family protein [Bacteroidota bacterium]
MQTALVEVPHILIQCPECGAPLPDGGSCRGYFHELLLLEAEVPGAPGAMPHFFAVASYNLQHPSQFTPAILTRLRASLDDALAGRASIRDLRRRARYQADGPARVLRRPGDVAAGEEQPGLWNWPTRWPMTVADVCRVSPALYIERVRQWAAAVSATLG